MTPDATAALSELTQRYYQEATLELLLPKVLNPHGQAAGLSKIIQEFIRTNPLPADLFPNHQNGKNGNGHHVIEHEPQKLLDAKDAKDPWTSEQWREEIVRFASNNAGIFSSKLYSTRVYDVADHGGISMGRSRVAGTLSDMVNRLKAAERIGKGMYRIAAAAPKEAAPKEEPTPDTPSLPEVPLSKAKADQFAILVQQYAHKQGGEFDKDKLLAFLSKRLDKQVRFLAGPLSILLNNENYFLNIGAGRYRWIATYPLRQERILGKGKTSKEGVSKRRPKGGDEPTATERLMEWAKDHNGTIVLTELQPQMAKWTGLDPHSIKVYSAMQTGLRGLQRRGMVKQTGKGRYVMTDDAPQPSRSRRTSEPVPDDDLLQFAAQNDGKYTHAAYKRYHRQKYGVIPSNGFLANRVKNHELNDELENLGHGQYKLVKMPEAAAAAG